MDELTPSTYAAEAGVEAQQEECPHLRSNCSAVAELPSAVSLRALGGPGWQIRTRWMCETECSSQQNRMPTRTSLD